MCITPEAGTMTKGLGGFQEADQMEIFNSITKYQGHVNNPARMAEITSRSFDIAMNERGPTQLNIPRDFFYAEGECISAGKSGIKWFNENSLVFFSPPSCSFK